jgi:hypothetical protein
LSDAQAPSRSGTKSGRALETKEFELVQEGGTWKVNKETTLPTEVPAGSIAVDVDMAEFSFTFDAAAMTSDQPLVLQAKNIGQQMHEIAMAKIPAEGTLEELLMTEEDVPGFELIGVAGPVPGGEEAALVLTDPLEPGRYAFVCFIGDADDPEGTPHAFKGMTADFTIE